eukprot:TRINITY_DN23167_c0_g1_i4.p1 TRINITY_DN23167_c0_g1~~TRINITY_DN23167_c0_g1_i4.p1  ORF type:complete len:257 (+),score=38.87 TRINITY_DN23167_c0_g1_i4:130-900(+)
MSLPRAFEKIIKLRNLDLAKLEPCAVLQAGQNFAVVVGTRHDCAVSAGRVRLAVETLGREMKGVAVELCTQRLPDLKGEKPLFTPEGIPYYSGTQKAVAAQKDFDKDMIQAIISSIRSSGVNMYLIDRYFAATKHRFYAELGRDEREMLQEGFDFETLLAISSTQQRLPDAVVARLPEEILSDGFRRAFGQLTRGWRDARVRCHQGGARRALVEGLAQRRGPRQADGGCCRRWPLAGDVQSLDPGLQGQDGQGAIQ